MLLSKPLTWTSIRQWCGGRGVLVPSLDTHHGHCWWCLLGGVGAGAHHPVGEPASRTCFSICGKHSIVKYSIPLIACISGLYPATCIGVFVPLAAVFAGRAINPRGALEQQWALHVILLAPKPAKQMCPKSFRIMLAANNNC